MAQEVKLHGGGAFDDATVTIDGHDVRIWHAAHRWGLDSNHEPGWWSECNDVLAGPYASREEAIAKAGAIVPETPPEPMPASSAYERGYGYPGQDYD